MRIYMQIPAMEERPPRFCHLLLEEDLIEGWLLVQESGYQGSPGKVKRRHYAQRDEAMGELIRNRDVQLSRGFQIVFIDNQGQSG